jgi:hypothetical protein
MAATFKQLIDKCIDDAGFRQKFIQDPVAAVESLGVPITPQLQQALQHLDTNSVRRVAIAMQGAANFT